jgi:hypothetical protein
MHGEMVKLIAKTIDNKLGLIKAANMQLIIKSELVVEHQRQKSAEL